MLLSPLLLKAFRWIPWVMLLAPLGLLAALNLDIVALPDWAYGPVTDFATFGSCWILGFAHHDGLLRKLRLPVVTVLALVLMALGLAWAATHLAADGWNLNDIPLAQGLWSLGFCAVLLRLSPVWGALPGRMRILDGLVTLMNNRAITIYLWHNLLLVAAVPLIDFGWENPTLSEAIPWLLGSDWLLFFIVWPLLGITILCVGWVEDIAARGSGRQGPRVRRFPHDRLPVAGRKFVAVTVSTAAVVSKLGRMTEHEPAQAGVAAAPGPADADAIDTSLRSPAQRSRTFAGILVNTALANITTSYLWFALTFWVYLETRNVIATGVIGGAYMLLIALSSISFGTFVDRYRKLAVMRFAAGFTLVMFVLSGVMFLLTPEGSMLDLTQPWFWIFAVIILVGAVVENMRNIALSTTVTILIEPDRRANANGLVGMVQGLMLIVTSVLSGLSVGLLGMGCTSPASGCTWS